VATSSEQSSKALGSILSERLIYQLNNYAIFKALSYSKELRNLLIL
jgi:hypothetical protein